MRLVVAVLMTVICVPSGAASDRGSYLAGLAGVPIRLFDLQAADVSTAFREFLSSVPMTNNRPLPARLVDDTVASLSLVKAFTPTDEPSYFVATYIQKTPLVTATAEERARYDERYGEAVYPQQICPVFINHANASVSRLLSTAVNLPASYFSDVNGSAGNFDRLFALTEASHCGFIARELVQPSVIPRGLNQPRVRSILEAVGDFEATAVFRSSIIDDGNADEADVLFAARLLAMFLLDRENAYTAVPGLLFEYERIGLNAAHLQMSRITASVKLARDTVRDALRANGVTDADMPIAELKSLLDEEGAVQRLGVDDLLARRLISTLQAAVRLIEGDRSTAILPHDLPPQIVAREYRNGLLTLGGAEGT